MMPPIRTAPTSTIMTRPVTQVGMEKEASITAATELACTVLPMPKPASAPKMANSGASHSHFLERPFLM
nr:hypothetical protein [uncultured Brevundimonas sp.]